MGKKRGWWMKTFHPSKCKAEANQEANNQANAVNAQAAQQLAAAQAQKDAALASVSTVYNEARTKIATWYTDEHAKAQAIDLEQARLYNIGKSDLVEILNTANLDIENGFIAQRDKLLEEQRSEEFRLATCHKEVAALAGQTEDYYGQHKFVVDNLWQQVKGSMLHHECQESYVKIKQPVPQIEKTKPFSLLLAYLRYLSKQNFGIDADFARYKSFLSALYTTEIVLEPSNDFNAMDIEIMALFARALDEDQNQLKNAYRADSKHIAKSYSNAREFQQALDTKIEAARLDIKNNCKQKMAALLKEKQEM